MSLTKLLLSGALALSLASTPGVAKPGPNIASKSATGGWIPTYQRTLEDVVMHSAPSLAMQADLFANLPKYSRVRLFVPEQDQDTALTFAARYNRNIEVYPYDEQTFPNLVWAQDLFETIARPSGNLAVLPFIYQRLDGWQDYREFATALKSIGFNVRPVSSYFEGGNITYDRFEGNNILLAGDATLVDEDWYPLEGPARRAAMDWLLKDFQADELIVLGRGQYSTPLFHIDQSFVLIAPGEAVVMSLENATFQSIESKIRAARVREFESDSDLSAFYSRHDYFSDPIEMEQKILDSRELQRSISKDLQDRGYAIHRFELDPWQLLHFQSYANSVVYTDATDNRRKVLLSIFQDEHGSYSNINNARAFEFFKKLGLDVIPVRNSTWLYQGNTNCNLNAYK